MTTRRSAQKQHSFQSYPHWDFNELSIPPRSRLFQLAPIGVGSLEIESLTSYIARLAVEHCISPRKLFCVEVLAQFGRDTEYFSTSSSFSAHTLNGTGEIAEIAARAFEGLTLRHDLRYTTFLMWREVFSPQSILRNHRAWCATCYEQQLEERGYAYDPLIWSVEAVSICYRHRERLCNVCPHCGNGLRFLDGRYRPGYCSKCLKWLGTTSISKLRQSILKSLTSTELVSQIIVLDIAGELLSRAPSLTSQPTHQIFLNNLIKIIGENAGHSINAFSDLIGMWSGKIRRLLAGQSKLSIESLCHLCTRLDISPMDLLCGKEGRIISEERAVLRRHSDRMEKLKTPWSEVESNLQAALEELPPPSMEAIARRLGYYPPRLKKHFAIVCEQISSRYKSYIKDIHPSPGIIQSTLRAALKEQPPPSLQSVFRRLGCRDTGYYYYSHHLDLCVAIAQRYKDHRNKPFDKKLTQEQLMDALKEDPAPSFSSVAKRLKHNRDFFRQKYPEITRAIAARHMHYLKSQREERAVKLRHMIREAIKSILAVALYASEARVKDNLRRHQFSVGRDSLFKQALREIKSEMGI